MEKLETCRTPEDDGVMMLMTMNCCVSRIAVQMLIIDVIKKIEVKMNMA